MQRHTLYLGHHYHDVAKRIINNTGDSLENLYEIYGEQLNHYHLLSEVISKIIECNQVYDIISIVSYLTAFELERFRAINYACIPEMPNEFTGEILHASNEIALCRIKSIKYIGFGLIVLVTKQQYSFDFEDGTGFVLGNHFRISGVISL